MKGEAFGSPFSIGTICDPLTIPDGIFLASRQQETPLRNAILLVAVPDHPNTNYCQLEVFSQIEVSMQDVWECPWNTPVKEREQKLDWIE